MDARHRAQLLALLHRTPTQLGGANSRWQLADLQQQVPAFATLTVAGISACLRRLRIHYKRSRSYIHSPDPAYDAKCSYLAQIKAQVCAVADTQVLLYLDEYTVHRQPLNGRAYRAAGTDQAKARRSARGDSGLRVVAALDARTGQVCARIAKKTDATCFSAFWRQLVACYPGKQIYVVLDNWPMHFHPAVLEELVEQRTPFAFPVSRSWRALVQDGRQPRSGTLPIQLVTLPTYASWLNPIEKLWLRLGQAKLVLHELADDLTALEASVEEYLAQFAHGSTTLLQAVGLLPSPPNKRRVFT